MNDGARELTFNPLTPIWTGDAHQRGGRLMSTGLLGSIRWWFEVLVRELGGSACGPKKSKCEGPDHCLGCKGNR